MAKYYGEVYLAPRFKSWQADLRRYPRQLFIPTNQTNVESWGDGSLASVRVVVLY